MKNRFNVPLSLGGALALLALADLPLHAQANRIVRTHVPPASAGNNSFFGRSAVNLGDVNLVTPLDGISDYAIAAFNSATGGPGAGEVTAFDGSNGSTLWSTVGSPTDNLGASLIALPDLTGDSRPELLVGAPGFGGGAGAVHVLDGGTGLIIGTMTLGPARVGLGIGLTLLPGFDVDFDGLPELAVQSQTTVDVFLSTGFLFGGALNATWPAVPQEIVFSAAGDFNLDGIPAEVALGNPGSSVVRVLDVNLGTSQTFTYSAPFSGFGSSITPTNLGNQLLVGAPLAGNGAGEIRLVGQNTKSSVAVGAAGSGLGSALALADIDGDGLVDILAGASASSGAQVLPATGGTQNVTGSSAATFGNMIVGLGDLNGDGFAEFLVGDPTAANTGSADVFFGGPAATTDQNFRPGCSNPFLPTIALNGALVLGTTPNATIANSAPSVGFFSIGTPDPVGTSLANVGFPIGCTSWLLLSAPITSLFYSAVNAGGTAGPINIPVPVNMVLLGAPIAFQCSAIYVGLNTNAVSNAVRATIGW